MIYILLDNQNKIIKVESEDTFATKINEDIKYPIEEVINNITEIKDELNQEKDMNLYQKRLIEALDTSIERSKFIYFTLKSFSNTEIIVSTIKKILEIPDSYLQIEDEVWQEALSIGANCFENGKFIVKDFSTLEQKINSKLSFLKSNTNFESPTVCLDIEWVGGYDSAQMLNAKRTLCLEMGLDFCAFTDSEDVDHILTLSQAKEVCIAVAADFEARRSIYKMKKRTIELCTTIEELEAIEI